MDKWNEVIEKAGELYGGNYPCCEAIILAISEYFGYQNDLLLKISVPLAAE